MVTHGRMPLSEAENDAVDKLAGEHEGEQLSLTRRDPGEAGPLLVHVGEHSWEIDEDGKRKKVT